MKRGLPLLDDVPFSPTVLRHLHSRKEYGTVVSVGLLSIIPVLMIEVYQKFTANKEHVCIYYPSCSEYSRLAYIRYGVIAASFLTLERLSKCNGFEEWPKKNKP